MPEYFLIWKVKSEELYLGWALRFIIYWASKFYIDQIFDLEEKLNTFLGKVQGGVIEVCIEYQFEDPV